VSSFLTAHQHNNRLFSAIQNRYSSEETVPAKRMWSQSWSQRNKSAVGRIWETNCR